MQQHPRTTLPILISSAFGSLLSTLITNPIQVAKLNQQYIVTTCPQYPHNNYRTMIDCQCSKFKIQNSFRGLGVAIPQIMLSNIIYMQLYQKIRKKALQHYNNTTTSTLLSSLTARLIVTTLAIPLESLRVRLSNLKQTDILKKSNGLKITLIRDLSYSSMFWMILETTRNYLSGEEYRNKMVDSKQQFVLLNMIPSMVAGSIVSTITTPLDTLKTRIQTQSKNIPIIEGLLNIYKNQGLMGLFLGVKYRVLKNTIHAALYLQIYQWSMRQFNRF